MLPYEIIFTFFFHLWFNVRVIVCFNVRHFMLAEVVSLSQVLSEKHKILSSDNLNNFFIFFWPSILLVLCCHSFVSYPPQRPMTSDFQGLSSQILSIPFFHTHHNGQWLLTSKDSHPKFYPSLFFIPTTTANDFWLPRILIPDFIHYFFCPIIRLENEPV